MGLLVFSSGRLRGEVGLLPRLFSGVCPFSAKSRVVSTLIVETGAASEDAEVDEEAAKVTGEGIEFLVLGTRPSGGELLVFLVAV